MMTREHHRRRSPESSRRRRKERRDSREQLQSQQIPMPLVRYEERSDPIDQSRAFSPVSSSSSTSSSLLNISRPQRFGLGRFFSGSNGRKQHRVKKKRSRFLRFGNSSSSSVGSDLAYGKGYIERGRSREFSPPSSHGRPALSRRAQTDEEILELGRKFAEIARQQNAEDLRAAGRTRPSALVGAAAALTQFRRTTSGTSSRGAGSSKPHRDSSPDDSEWESASDDDDSSSSEFDSGLAYGSGLSLQSTSAKQLPPKISPRSSPRSLKAPYEPPLRRKPSVVDPNLFGPVNSLRGYVETPCGFEKVDRSTVVDGRRPYEPSVPPSETVSGSRSLQRVYPVPTSDPERFDARGSVVSSQQDLSTRSRPGPSPIQPPTLQQPRPIAPVSRKVLDSVETDSKYSDRSLSKRVLEEAAVAGVAGAAVGAALGSERRSDRDKSDKRGRDRDGKRLSKRSDAGVHEEKALKRRSRDELREVREVQEPLSEKRQEKRSLHGQDSERERLWREKIVPELKRESEKEGRRREDYPDEAHEYDRVRARQEDERKEGRRIDRNEALKEERRDERRNERPEEPRGEEQAGRIEGRSYERPDGQDPSREGPVDPFQFQVADDAFQTPLYTTPKRPLTPNVITVDREPDFSRFELREDDVHPQERLSRRDSYERELREAREAYEAAEHATAPVSEAAFAAAAAAVIAEERRGRSRSRGSDATSRNRSHRGESPKRERDAVLEDANRYYREAELARRIREEEERSRSKDEESVLDKWKHEQKQPVVDIVPPPEMAHPKQKSPYDGPDADVRIDNVLEHPSELSRFRVSDSRGRSKVPVFRSRDPSAERERPMLNVVRPTPIPSPMPEEQPPEQRPSSETTKAADDSISRSKPDVVISSRGEVAQTPPTPKAVTWGENQTKHYVVESPEREDDPYSGAKIVTPAKTPKSRPAKKSAWGFIASAIGGSSSAAASSSVSDRSVDTDPKKNRRASRDQEKSTNRRSLAQVESMDETPPVPGPKPPSPRGAQMPGSFAEDPAFTANIAAALEGSGFDPNIVIDDASFHRRDSPPSSNDSGVYRSPFVESVTDLGTSVPTASQNGRDHGFVIGEVETPTPSDEKDVLNEKAKIPSELNEKDQRQQEKAAERDSSEKREVVVDNGKAADISRPIVEGHWDAPSSELSRKESKRREKATRGRTLEDERAVDDSSRKGQALEAEFLGAVGADEDEDSSLKRRKSKKSQKAIVVQDDSRPPDVVESSKAAVPGDDSQDTRDAKSPERPKITIPVNAFQDVREAETVQPEDTRDALKKSRTETKRGREVYDSPSRPTSKPEASDDRSRSLVQSGAFSTPDYEQDSSMKHTRSRRDSESYGSPSRTVPASELSRESSYKIVDTDSIPATEEEWDTPKKSMKKSRSNSEIYDSPTRSALASQASLELVRKPTDPEAISLPGEDTLRKSNKDRRGTIDYEFTRSPFQSVEDLSTPKKSKKSRRSSVTYDSSSRVESVAEDTVESPREMAQSFSGLRSGEMAATEEEPSTPKKAKKKSKRDSVAYDDLPSTPVSQSGPPSEVSTSSKISKRDSGLYDSPSRSTPVSDRGTDDSPKKSRKKKKRRSTIGDFPETSDKPNESEPPDRGRDRFEVSERNISSTIPDPTRSDSHRSTKSRAIEEVMDETRSLASSPSGSDRRDRKGSKAEKEKRSSGGSSFLDRFKSSIGISEEKERSRKSEEDKKNSFLDNADTLGAGVGSKGVADTPAFQESRSNATNVPLEEEAQTVPFTPVRQSTLPLESEFIDPEIAPREIRPAIDPTYGDLLPLPPSRTGSPVPELGDTYPDLPDSRPETPERERHLREIQTHIRRRSAHETPTRPRTPSQSAIPIQFRLGHRHTPSNGRSSPLVSPIVGSVDFGSEPKSRSRPTSWESSRWEGHREFKPLLLLQRASRGSIGSIDTSSSPERDVSPSESEIREHRSQSLRRLLAGDSPDRNVPLRDSPLGTPVESIHKEPSQTLGVKSPAEVTHGDGLINKHSDEFSRRQDIEGGDSHLPPVPELPALESAEDTELISPKSKSIEPIQTVPSPDVQSPGTAQEPTDVYILSSPSPAPGKRSNMSEKKEDLFGGNRESATAEAETTTPAIEEPESVLVPDDHGPSQKTEFADSLEVQNKEAVALQAVSEVDASKSTDTLVTAPQSATNDNEATKPSSSSEKTLEDEKVQGRELSETRELPQEPSAVDEAPLAQDEPLPSVSSLHQGPVTEQIQERAAIQTPIEDVSQPSKRADTSDVKREVSSSSQAFRQEGWLNKLRSSWGTGLTSWSKRGPEGTDRIKEEQASGSKSTEASPSGSRILEELKKRRSEEVSKEISSALEPAPKPEPVAEASNDQQSPVTTSKKGKKKKRKSQSQVVEPSLNQSVVTDGQDIGSEQAPTQSVDDITPTDNVPTPAEKERSTIEGDHVVLPETSTTVEQSQIVEPEIPLRESGTSVIGPERAGIESGPSTVEPEVKPVVQAETFPVPAQSQTVELESPPHRPEPVAVNLEPTIVESKLPTIETEAQPFTQPEPPSIEPEIPPDELERPVVESKAVTSHPGAPVPEPGTSMTEPELGNVVPRSSSPGKEVSVVDAEISTQSDISPVEQEIQSTVLEHPVAESETATPDPDLRDSKPETSTIGLKQTLIEPTVPVIEPESIISELGDKDSLAIEPESTATEKQSSVETETFTKPEIFSAEPEIPSTESERAVVEPDIASPKPEISAFESNQSTIAPAVSVIEQEPVLSEGDNKRSFTTEPELATGGKESTSGENESSNAEVVSVTQPEVVTVESEIPSQTPDVSMLELNDSTIEQATTAAVEPTLSTIEAEQVATKLESKATPAATTESVVEPDSTIVEKEKATTELAPISSKGQLSSVQDQPVIAEAEKSEHTEPVLESSTVSKKEKKKKKKGKKQQSLESEFGEPATPLEESTQLAEQPTQESLPENAEVPLVEPDTSSRDQLEAVLQESHEIQPIVPEETPSTPKKSKKKKKGKKAQTANLEPETEPLSEQVVSQGQQPQPLSGEISSLPTERNVGTAPQTETQISSSLPEVIAGADADQKATEQQLLGQSEEKKIIMDRSDSGLEAAGIVAAPVMVGEQSPLEESLKTGESSHDREHKSQEIVSQNEPVEPTVTESKADILTDFKPTLSPNLEDEQSPVELKPVSQEAQLASETNESEKPAEISILNEGLNTEEEHVEQHMMETSLQSPVDQEQSGSKSLETGNVDESLPQPNVLGGEHARDQQVPASIDPPEAPLSPSNPTENLQEESPAQIEAVEEPVALPVEGEKTQSSSVSNQPVADESREMALSQPESSSKKRGKKNRKKRQDTSESVDTTVATEIIEESVPPTASLEASVNEEHLPVSNVQEDPTEGTAELAEPVGDDLWFESTTAVKKRKDSDNVGSTNEPEAVEAEGPLAEPESQSNVEIVQEPSLERVEPKTGEDVAPEVESSESKSEKNRQPTNVSAIGDEPEFSNPGKELALEDQPTQEPTIAEAGAESIQSIADSGIPTASRADTIAGDELEKTPIPEVEVPLSKKQKKKNKKKRGSIQLEAVAGDVSQGNANDEATPPATATATDAGTTASDKQVGQVQVESGDIVSTPKESKDGEERQTQSLVDTEGTTVSPINAPEISAEPSAISEEIKQPETEDLDTTLTPTSPKKSKKKKKKRQSVQLAEPAEQGSTESRVQELVSSTPATDASMAFDTDWASADIPAPPSFWSELTDQPDHTLANVDDSPNTEIELSQDRQIDPVDQVAAQNSETKQFEVPTGEASTLESQDINVSAAEEPSIQKDAEILGGNAGEIKPQPQTDTLTKNEVENVQPSFSASEVVSTEQQDIGDKQFVETVSTQEPVTQGESQVESILSDQEIPTQDTLPTQYTLPTESSLAEISQSKEEIDSTQPSSNALVAAEQQVLDDQKPIGNVVEQGRVIQGESLPTQDNIAESFDTKNGAEQPADIHVESDVTATPQVAESIPVLPTNAEDDQLRGSIEPIAPSNSQAEPSSSAQDAAPAPAEDELPSATKKSKKDKKKRKSKTQDTLDSTTDIVIPSTEPNAEVPSITQTESAQIVPDVPITTEPEEFVPQPQEEDSQNVATKKSKKDKKKKRPSQVHEADSEPPSSLSAEESMVERPQSPVRDDTQIKDVEPSDLLPAQEIETQQHSSEEGLSGHTELSVPETIETPADVVAPTLTTPEPESHALQVADVAIRPQEAKLESVIQTEKAGADTPAVEAEPETPLSQDAIGSRDGKETQQVADIPESSVPEKEPVAEPPAPEENSEVPTTPKSKKDKKKKKKRGSQAALDDTVPTPSQETSESISDVQTPAGEAATSAEGAISKASEDGPVSAPEKKNLPASISSELQSTEPETESQATSQPIQLSTETGPTDSVPAAESVSTGLSEILPKSTDESPSVSTQNAVSVAEETLPSVKPVEVGEEQVVKEPSLDSNAYMPETVPSDDVPAAPIPIEPIAESINQPEVVSQVVEEEAKDVIPSVSLEQDSTSPKEEPVQPDQNLNDGPQTIASEESVKSLQPGEPLKSDDLSLPTEPSQLEESLRSEMPEREREQVPEPEKLQEQSQELTKVEEPIEIGQLDQPGLLQAVPLKTETLQPEEAMQLVDEPSATLDDPEATPAKKSKKDKKKKKRASQVEPEPLPETISVPDGPAEQPPSDLPSELQLVEGQPVADTTTTTTDAAKPEDAVPEVSTSKKSKKKKKRASQIEPESSPATPSEPQAQEVLPNQPLVQEPLPQSESQPQVEEPLPIEVEESPEENPSKVSGKKTKKERRKSKQLAASTAKPEPEGDLIVEDKPAAIEAIASHVEQPTEPVNQTSEGETSPSTTLAGLPGDKLQTSAVVAESSSHVPGEESTSAAENVIPIASEDIPYPAQEEASEHAKSVTVTAEQVSSEPVQAVDLNKDKGEISAPIDQERRAAIPEQDRALPETDSLAKHTPTVSIPNTEVGRDQTNASPSPLPKDGEQDGEGIQVPSIPDLSGRELLNVDLQPQDSSDPGNQGETALSGEPIIAEEQLQVGPKDIQESRQTLEMGAVEPQEPLPAGQQAEPETSLPKEPEPPSSPVSRKKSKKDKKKKRAGVQLESETASGSQTPSNQELTPGGTSNETIAAEPKTLKPGSTITNEGEWPVSPIKSKKDKKRRKASGTSTPMESMEAVPANAPETVTQENAPGRLTLEAISEVEGQSSISKDLDIPPKPEGQEKNAEDVHISHPIRETVAVSKNVDLASPAAEKQRTQLNERPTNETAQDIPSQVEVSVPVSRPRTPTTSVQPTIGVDLSPAQLTSHLEHDRPFDQSPQPGKKARTHLSSDDATIPEPLSAQADVLPQGPESASREVSQSSQPTEGHMPGIEVSDAVTQDMTPAREIAASYLESHPTSTDDKDIAVEENQSVEQINNAGLLPVITPQREIAASYIEGGATTEVQTDDNYVEDSFPRGISNAQMTAPEDVPALHTELQSIHIEPEHAEEKTLPTQHTEATWQSSPIAAPSAREIAAGIMESHSKYSGKGHETPRDMESTATGAIPDALETGGARLDADAGSIWARPSTEAGRQIRVATPEPMVVESPGNLQSQDSVTDNAESPVVGREVKRDLPEHRDVGHESPTPREPPASEIIKKLDDLDTSEHANEAFGPKKEHKIDDKSLKSLSPRPDYSSSGRASPRVLPPVEEETHEDLQKEQQSQVRDVSGRASIMGPITVPNRDSGFSSGSPHPKRRSFVDPSLRDSGVHLRDWPEGTPKRDDELPEEERSAIGTPQPNERRSKKLGLGSETPKLETPVRRSVEDEAKNTTDPKKTSAVSSKYGEVGQRSVSDNISRSSTPRTENQPRRSASNTSISRLRTPEPLQFRPNSPGRSSFRPGTNTPPLSLRRVDKRMSGDLRSLSSNLSNNSASRENLHQSQPQHTTPVANEGRVRAKDMTDVYDGYGEGRIGSPRSPTRPQSMRRRQSMQVLELESRVDQLIAENRALADAKTKAEQNLNNQNNQVSSIIAERDAEIESLKASLEWLRKEVTRLTEVNEGLHSANNVLALQHSEKYNRLESQHASAFKELEEHRFARGQYTKTLQQKDAEIQELRAQLEATKEQVREMQRQILASKPPDAEFLRLKDEDHFEHRCQQLCSHVQQWVLRFSKFSDMRACRLTTEINDEKIIDRLDNSVLDGSDVDDYLRDRVRRRDVFMSMAMNMIWEFVFTRYLFGMDREQRQKLKSLEKLLLEVGPPQAVRQWRAVTLTLLSKRPAFGDQRNQDTEAVVQAIFQTLCMILPPPSNLEGQIQSQLRRVMREAVDLSIEMRTQRAEYMMLPPLQPEYDANGDLVKTVSFNAALMNERSGDKITNEEYEAQGAIVRVVLFPLVVKKGDDNGVGDEEIVIFPAQVLVAKPPRATVRMVTPSSDAGGVPLSRGATPSVGAPGSNVSLQMPDAPPLPIPTPPRDDYI